MSSEDSDGPPGPSMPEETRSQFAGVERTEQPPADLSSRPPSAHQPIPMSEPVPWDRVPDYLPFGLIAFDTQQNVVFSNERSKELLGIGVEECTDIEGWFERTCPNPDYAARVLNSWREHVWRKQLSRTFSLKGADQKLKEIEFTPKLMDDGGLLVTLMDVTEARRKESTLRLGEKKFRTVFVNDPGGLVLVDRTGRILDANPSFEEFTGKSVTELRKMALGECLVPQDGLRLRAAEERMNSTVSGGENDTIEVRFRRNGASSATLPSTRLTICPIRDDEGRTLMGLYFLSGPEEKTETAPPPEPETKNRQSESNGGSQSRELEQSHRQNLALLSLIPDLILLIDRDLNALDVSPPSPESWTGPKVTDAWREAPLQASWPELFEAVRSDSKSVFSGETISCREFQTKKSGPFAVSLTPCGGDRILVRVADISEDQSLRLTARWQETALERLDEPIVLTDLKGTVLAMNPAVISEFGYRKNELLGYGISRLYARGGDAAREFNTRLSKALNEEGKWSGRSEFFRKDGSTGVCRVSFTPVLGEDGRPTALLAIQRPLAEAHDGTDKSLTEGKIDSSDLIHEQMQHRFRNQLQLVTSLFSLEQEAGSDEADSKENSDRWQIRLRVMAEAHAHLHGQDDTVWIDPLIRSISDEVTAVYGCGPGRREVVLSGTDSIRIDAEIATPFSLLIGEILRLALQRTVSTDCPAVFLELFRKSGAELGLVATPGAGGDLFPGATDQALVSMNNLARQLRGRLQMTKSDGTQALTLIFSSGVKPGNE
ncbi:MAG: PAS domain S-box protein [Verrucomicrobiales bacterium]|nr:PAS domain S-box protein [Verrucomicrobiales bacterium]